MNCLGSSGSRDPTIVSLLTTSTYTCILCSPNTTTSRLLQLIFAHLGRMVYQPFRLGDAAFAG